MHRIAVLSGLVMTLLVPIGPPTPAAMAAAVAVTEDVALTPVATGMSFVLDVDAPNGDPRLFIVEKAGLIRVMVDGDLLPTPFLDIRARVNDGASERGLLGIAFAPNYATTGEFYVNYTAEPDGRTRISEFTVSQADPDVADAGSEKILLSVSQPAGNHNGGALAFGGDGFLYVALGDGGGGGDTFGNGQNTSTLLGSILRIARTGAAAPGNPFIGQPGQDRIWAYGVRNPWRMAVDPATGDIWFGDVGQDAWEEVDRIPAGVGGLNFGWNTREGDHCFNPPSGCASAGLAAPVLEYAHGPDPCSASITGGVVYRGNEVPKLRGHYFYADYCKRFIRSFRYANGNVLDKTDWTSVLGLNDSVLSFGTDGYGELYVATFSTVYKLVSAAPPACDFDGDGNEDVPIGVPTEAVGGVLRAGAVQVMYGSASGLDPADDQFFTQETPGIVGVSRDRDLFGSALACADFNGDGFADLAVGVPGKEISNVRDSGAVVFIPGSATGLDASSSVRLHQDTAGVTNLVEKWDRFGSSLAAGDFNRDGRPDLAVGVPGERVAGVRGGAVHVLYGGGGLIPKASDRFFAQGRSGVPGSGENGDRFGHDVAAGDFDGDGDDDLAIGIPWEAGGGAIQLLKGGPAGLVPTPQLRTAAGAAEFGSAVAAGATDEDGFDDLVSGAPGSNGGAGAVFVLRGRSFGLGIASNRYEQGVGIWNIAEAGDRFGAAVATGDVDGDGLDDVVVGAPGEMTQGRPAGIAHVLYGGVGGPRRDTDQLLNPKAWLPGTIDDYVELGAATALRDVDGDGDDDVIVGAPGSGGVVLVVPAAGGIRRVDAVLIDQNTAGVEDIREFGDRFGGAL